MRSRLQWHTTLELTWAQPAFARRSWTALGRWWHMQRNPSRFGSPSQTTMSSPLQTSGLPAALSQRWARTKWRISVAGGSASSKCSQSCRPHACHFHSGLFMLCNLWPPLCIESTLRLMQPHKCLFYWWGVEGQGEKKLMLQLKIEWKNFLCAIIAEGRFTHCLRSHICELCLAGVYPTHETILGGVKVAQNLAVHISRDVHWAALES